MNDKYLGSFGENFKMNDFYQKFFNSNQVLNFLKYFYESIYIKIPYFA